MNWEVVIENMRNNALMFEAKADEGRGRTDVMLGSSLILLAISDALNAGLSAAEKEQDQHGP